ncbi:MAG: AgmX/PglI C-terminal domain-containing protein [Polyangiales bacterium]
MIVLATTLCACSRHTTAPRTAYVPQAAAPTTSSSQNVPSTAHRGYTSSSEYAEIVRGTIRKNWPDIERCYSRELERNPYARSGQVVLEFLVMDAGKVQSATVARSTLGLPRVESCLADAAQRWRFPPTNQGGVILLLYPSLQSSIIKPFRERTFFSKVATISAAAGAMTQNSFRCPHGGVRGRHVAFHAPAAARRRLTLTIKIEQRTLKNGLRVVL